MYLARLPHNGHTRYVLRESYDNGGTFRSRDILDLGTNPARCIEYPGGNAFYLNDEVSDALSDHGSDPGSEEIELLFWPFLKPDIRRALEHFVHRRGTASHRPPTPPARTPHVFDKRRLHFLRCGRTDIGAIGMAPEKMFRDLWHKSRDEIEQQFIQWEVELKPVDRKTYVYAVFDLQQVFRHPLAGRFPSAMDTEQMDDAFLDALCARHEDRSFWEGFPVGDALHPYLARYVVMYFDHPFPRRNIMGEYIREFMDNHRDHRPPPPSPRMGRDEAIKRLGLARERFTTMTRSELTRHYRRIALRLHPDHGGRHDRFIRVTEAYQELMERIRSRT